MAFTIDGTNGLTFNNATTQASAGVVLQVVNATTSTQTTTSSSSFSDTGLTATITPKFATSKILVLVTQNGCAVSNGSTNYGQIQLLRGATVITSPSFSFGFTGTSLTNRIGSISTNYLDSPATTSATIYKTQVASGNNTSNTSVQQDGCTSTISLMEIAQ